MRKTLLLTPALLCLCACGESQSDPDPTPTDGLTVEDREAGFKNNERTVWWVERTSVDYDECSDWSEFTDGIEQFAASLSDTFVSYGGNTNGSVDLLSCTSTGKAESCSRRSPPVTYSADGLEYTQTFTDEILLRDINCREVRFHTVVLTDAGQTMEEKVTQRLMLEGEGCATWDENARNQGSNGFGIDGCTITYTSHMTLRDVAAAP